MLQYSRTFDSSLIEEIIKHPKIWPYITDDLCPPKEEYEVLFHASVWYVLVHWVTQAIPDGVLAGMFTFHPRTSTTFEVHTCLLPWTWAKRRDERRLTVEAAQGVVQWMFRHSPCKRVTTSVPAYNRLALKLAQRAGLTQFGVDPTSFQKHGVMHDQILLGISKE